MSTGDRGMSERIRTTTTVISLDGCIMPIVFIYGGVGLLLGLAFLIWDLLP